MFMFSVLGSWTIFFSIWMVWESVLRILVKHPWWDIRSALLFLASNFLLGLLCALVFGMLHLFLLIVLRVLGRYPTLAPRRIVRPIPVLIVMFFPVVVMLAIQFLRTPPVERSRTGGIQSIVLISVDTLRHDYVGAYGASNVRTPSMDRIAEEGALFRVALAPVPETGPSHTSMLTGKTPLQHGVRFNGQPLRKKDHLLAVQLRKAGFKTAAFISGYPLNARNSGLDHGFQIYSDKLALKDYFNKTYAGRWIEKLPWFKRGVYRQAPEVTGEALRWLSRNAGSPYFLFVHYFDPHYPYGIKARLRNAKHPLYVRASPEDLPLQRQRYAQEVELVDAHIGRIVRFLKESGTYDRTLLIVTADHGESLGEHNYYYDHGRFVYEQLVRVPLLVRCPPAFQGPLEFREPVSVSDIYSTVLGAAGVSTGRNDAGTYNLIQLVKRAPAGYDRILLAHNFTNRVNSIRTNRWKLIETRKPAKKIFELYDLVADPGELQNVFATHPELSRQLMEQMRKMMNLHGYGDDSDWSTDQLSPEDREALESLGYLDD